MIYVTSDLHGNLDGFLELLKKINLDDNDTLYVLGDIVDRGPKPIELLMDMACRVNVIPILGNHDYIAFRVLSQLLGVQNGEEVENYLDKIGLSLYGWWMANEGKVTLEAFLADEEEEREAILDYFSEFSLFEEIEAGGVSYVLVHAGIQNFSTERLMQDYDLKELLFEKPDYSKVYFEDKILVTGHTPTSWIDSQCKGKVYRGFNHLAIDLSFENKIAVVRLDDGKEFYI